MYPLFEALDKVEAHLEKRGGPYLFGEGITDADIRLYVTIVRFDPAYVVSESLYVWTEVDVLADITPFSGRI